MRHELVRARLGALLCAAAVTTVSLACTTSPAGPSEGHAADLALCASEINRYRSIARLGSLTWSESLERFAGEAAQHDAAAGVPHLLFTSTNGGNGVARAETQLLKWRGYSVAEVIRRGLAEMWAAGPGGAHYDVMLGAYTEVGCGVFVDGAEVSVSQAYR